MKKALIFHGTMGSPDGNWFPWLQEELMLQEWQVAVPKLPTPEGQTLENWITALEEQVPGYADADLLIGHSCGATFCLRLIEKKLITPKQAILVSTVKTKINNEEYDALNHSFIEPNFNWQTIKNSGTSFTLIHGDNDPYVPLNQPEAIADALDITLHMMKDGGHLNAESGFTDFPEILDFIDISNND